MELWQKRIQPYREEINEEFLSKQQFEHKSVQRAEPHENRVNRVRHL